jgi:high-affinity Fe2+/Pb2+ permease
MFKKKKMKLLVVVFIVIHITILAASAHGTYESFFGSNSPIAFTWGVISNGKAVLTINDDYIDY